MLLDFYLLPYNAKTHSLPNHTHILFLLEPCPECAEKPNSVYFSWTGKHELAGEVLSSQPPDPYKHDVL